MQMKERELSLQMPVASATVIAPGDWLYWDVTNLVVKPLSDLAEVSATEAIELAKNRAKAAKYLAGVANGHSRNGDTADIQVTLDGVQLVIVTSAIYSKGDLLTPKSNAGALYAQEFEKTTIESMAVAVVTKNYSSAVTAVEAAFIGKGGYQADGKLLGISGSKETWKYQMVVGYDFAVSGGGITDNINLGLLPAGAIITDGWYYVETALTSPTGPGDAKMALGIATEDVDGILAAAVVSSVGTAGSHAIIQTGAVANFSNITLAERQIHLDFSVEAVTAGKFKLYLEYFIPGISIV